MFSYEERRKAVELLIQYDVGMQQLSMNWAIRLEKHCENGTTSIERMEIFTKSTKVVIPRRKRKLR